MSEFNRDTNGLRERLQQQATLTPAQNIKLLDDLLSRLSLDSDQMQQIQARKREDAQILEALCFARSAIRCGEPWTDKCEEVIGGAIRMIKDKAGDYECIPGPRKE